MVSWIERSASRTREQRIGDVVGLAEPERQAEHELGSDLADDIIRNRLGVAEYFRHWNDPGNYGRGRPESGHGRLSHLFPIIVCDEGATATREFAPRAV